MENKTFIRLYALSHRLGLPAAWLRAEAEAGRIPCLRTGRRLMFNVDAVRQALMDRSLGHDGPDHGKGVNDGQ